MQKTTLCAQRSDPLSSFIDYSDKLRLKLRESRRHILKPLRNRFWHLFSLTGHYMVKV